jgi:uncharacterized protein (TIGR04255 family)
MANPRPHLSKAPAREALIDLQFEPAVSLDLVDKFVAIAAPSFESQVDLVEAFVGFGPDGTQATASHAVIGRRLDSQRTHYVLQCRTSGFTLSRLSPYGEWADLRREASRWWEVFCRVANPQTISRIAVRYINAVKIPLPMTDFSEYLSCPPLLPEGLPQALSGFLQRVIVPDDQVNCISVVTQALEGQPTFDDEGGSVTVLLDIDVFRTTRIGHACLDDAWKGLDELRQQKNRMFFAHLTEKTVEMFL